MTKDKRKIFAVKELNLRVSAGQIFGLLGPNGAGKTTLVRMLTTILRPDSGTARIMGHDILQNPVAVRKQISVVLQETAVEPLSSVRDNLLIYGVLHGLTLKTVTKRMESLLEQFDLKDKQKEIAQDLSMGTRRRLQVAKILLVDAPVIFLDEATTGMDPLVKRSTLEVFKKLANDGKTILLTTQLLNEAEALCDEIAILNKGQTIASGDFYTLKNLTQKRFHISLTVETPEGIEEKLKVLQPQALSVKGDVIEMNVIGEEASILAALAQLSQETKIDHFEMRGVDLEDIFIDLIQSRSEQS
ncbi:ABC transporter ATP-binding protein [bacterium]|nr:ABC transporter ATP-binding protein [bacterium]